MAVAMQWVARVFAAAMMMTLPGLAGQWLDKRLGTHFIVLIGFALGLVGSMAYLIAVTRASSAARTKSQTDRDDARVDE